MVDSARQMEVQLKVVLTVPKLGHHNPNCVSPEEDGLPYPALAPVVIFGLKQTTKLRNWCLKLTCGLWLDFVSNLMVLVDFVALVMYKLYEDNIPILEKLEFFFFGFFMVEMLIKMVALGVSGCKGSYLSNNWNKLDVLVNTGQALDFIIDSRVLSEVLRSLRPISRVPCLRDLVMVLLRTTPMLGKVLILFMFVIHIFAVVGVQLWVGQLRNRCFRGGDIPTFYNMSLSPYYVSMYDEKYPFICSPDGKSGMRRCHDVPPYKLDGETCLSAPPRNPSPELVPTVAGASVDSCINWNMYYNICLAGDHNPQRGAINFDNIGFAWITIFQVVTLEGWSEIMFYVMDAHSYWSFMFFKLATIIGSFIMMNLCAVVIATQFSENMQRDTGGQGAVAAALLHGKLACWLQEISRLYKRLCNKVQPRSSSSSSISTSTSRGKCASLVQALMVIIKRIVESQVFDRVIMVVVFLSILTMAIEHHRQSKDLTIMLQISNIIYTIIFLVEMILKLLALKCSYFMDKNNIFDFIIVIISLWENISKADGRLSVLRAFRLLRFGRLVHFLPYLKRQLLVLKSTMEEAAVFFGLLLLVTFIFSIVGMYLFRGKFTFQTPHGDIAMDRKNFDSLLWSMVTVFQILTLEDWNLVLYNAMAATSPWAALYFFVVILFGKYFLLNVLVGIVVEGFQAKEPLTPDQDSACGPSGPTVVNSASEEDATNADTNKDDRSLTWRVLRWCKEHEDWSFFVLSPQNRFRIFCQRVVSHKMFDYLVLFFILLNCVTIAMERPGIDPESTERWILRMSRYVFSAVFLVEMLFKVLALGLLFGKECYCRSSWNVVDGSLVILSLVHVFVSLANMGENNMLGILKVLRLLRTFRPLRVIKRAPKLKLAVEALIASVKPIGNIVFISCIFFFFYGILGVQLFKGKFYYCEGYDVGNITNMSDCLSANYRWVQKEYNFDSLPQALMSLFVMYSRDGWVNIMYDGLDAVGIDKQPVRNHNEWMLLFFISYMIMSLFLLDMFIGVMVETFHQCQQDQKRRDAEEGALEEKGEVLPNQHTVPEPVEVPYYMNYSPIRRSIHTLCTSDFLDLFMTVIIFISVLMMAFEHYNQPQYVQKLTEYSYYVFTAILMTEVLLKLVAFGVRRFMTINWNLLDVAIILISIISIVFTEMKMTDLIPINPSILRVCRVLRLAQVLKAKKIRVLLKTIIKTLTQVKNICLLFTFFFFIYAALGVELFGKLECSEDYPCLGLHRYSNFKNFGIALLTLYIVCTGDNWSAIMKDTFRKCRPSDEGCLSCLSWVSPICFISFVVMAQFVLANLVVAAIMQASEDSNEEEDEDDAERVLSSPEDSSIHVAAEGPSVV